MLNIENNKLTIRFKDKLVFIFNIIFISQKIKKNLLKVINKVKMIIIKNYKRWSFYYEVSIIILVRIMSFFLINIS